LYHYGIGLRTDRGSPLHRRGGPGSGLRLI
jgi:hypothetical protein